MEHRRTLPFLGYFACDSQPSRTRLHLSRRKSVHIYARVSHTRVLRLAEALGYESIDIDLTCCDTIDADLLQQCDLILIDAVYLTEAMQQYLVEWIRLHTFAPVVVMGKRSYWRDVSSVLTRGADGIVWLDDPIEVNIAHCRAILRRAGVS